MDNVRPRGSYSPIKRSYYTKPTFRPKDLKQDVKTFGVQNMTTAGTRAVVNTGKGKLDTDLKKSRWVWRPKGNYLDHVSKDSGSFMLKKGNPEILLQDHAVVDSGCSSHMTGNKAYLSDYEDFNGGFVAFGSDPKGDELKFNLFSVSQMWDKKICVLFTKSECLILSPSFKLLDESQVVLRAPRKDDVYSLDLKNIVPSRGHLVKGLPSKVFVNDHTCVACKKGKQHKASYKAKLERIIKKPLELLHMDLFRHVYVESINKKRCDNGTEFKNYAMNEFCAKKGIKREFSVARTPQQNGVAERKNRTLIEAAITMLADSLLPILFWAKAVNIVCYVLNRVLVTKPQNKTPYELLIGTQDSYVAGSSRKDKGPTQEYILLPLQPHRIRIPIKDVAPVAHETPFESSLKENNVQDSEDAANKESEQDLQDELEMMVTQELATKAMDDVSRQAFEEEKRRIASQKKAAQATSTNKLSTVSTDRPYVSTDRPFVSTDRSNTPYVSAASTSTGANTGESSFVYLGGKILINASTLPNADLPIDPNMPDLEDASDTLLNDGIFNGAYDDDEDVGVVANFNNMDNIIVVSPIPILRSHKDHPKGQILGDPTSAVQTRGKIQKASSAQQALFKLQKVWVLVDLPYGKKEEGIDYDEVFALVAKIEAIRLFLAFASYMGFTVYQMDVKSAFLYGTIEEEVYVHQPPGFVDPAHPNKVYKVIKALYGLHQALRAWYETLSSFLMENGFRRGTIDKTLFIKKRKSDIMLVQVYVDDIIFSATKKSMCTEFEECMHKRFQMSSIGKLTFFLGLQVKQQPDGIFISQDKYVADILKKFDFLSIRIATTPIESNKPLVKDKDGVDVDVHVHMSMIGSLMYLTASRQDIMFVVCACARFQVTLKASHLNTVKRIFRYLKHQPKLGLWYPRDLPFELEAYLDNEYRGASLDRKSTTSGCQFLSRRLISWQSKKQTIVANSTTVAEYVAAANCCGQVLWIQNQMMDYGFNFMNTKIHIDNESTISVIKNPVAHSRTKHIEIQFHFIRDCYEKRLIEVIKIHTDHNVADLLTKGFDVTRISMDLRMDRSCAANSTHIWSYSDKHNMVAFLKKPNESVGFTEVVDFLKVKTLANGTQQLVTSIDSKEYTITEASVRSKLQLADATGIHNLSDAEIYAGLATFGPKSGGWDQFGSTIATALICLSSSRVYNFSKMIFDGMVHNLESNTKILMYSRFLQIILDITTESKGRYLSPTLTKKIFANMKRGYAGDIVPLLPAMLAGAAIDQGKGSAQPHHILVDPLPFTSQPPISSPTLQSPTHSPPIPSPPLYSPTHSSPHYSPPRSYEAPLPEGNTSGSVEASMQLRELMVLVPTLVTRINSLEKEFKDTKQTLGDVVLKLVKKVKSLEIVLKRKSKKVIVSESEGEELED
ncbi:putative ribonuclease H-like domain-containing protein [Tanacetum coccineum]